MQKPPSYARRLIRAGLLAFLRERWQVPAVLCAATLVIAALFVLTGQPPFMQGLAVGVTVSLLGCAVWYVFLMATGHVLTLAGIWAERFTNDELKAARKRGHIWGHVENIELAGFDIDHLVVAPRGVVAIETKSHMVRLTGERWKEDLRQARLAADKARSVLRSKDIGMLQEVSPVLVLWGRHNTSELPSQGVEMDGVHVVAVGDLADWLGGFSTGRVGQDYAERLLARLQRFRDTRQVRDPVLR